MKREKNKKEKRLKKESHPIRGGVILQWWYFQPRPHFL
ncbi:hypothetical protein HPHPP15B_0011 [Helicobacter pylori Hp P-15b]|uniref:Uncharacterized protein n=1 Tax=Helicobacter pylori Hp P-15 TaxID=992080 RepID=J0QD59_HELPX|nr:hypothetical protein HPHPP15_0008 [Helicobacter pylori Hp P-15]EJC33917.1 hypothetical protein HPHPP15B_0011 [Helicobacter pylori Hp P-15b]